MANKIDIDTKQQSYKYELTPFQRCVLQNFPFIEEDFDALTNYGLLCKVVEYLNKVITNQNTVQENVTNLNTAFIELKNYVDSYLETALQTDVDKKLDEMAEDGTLEELISKYIDEYVERVFHNVQDMKAEDLQDNMKAKTLGYYLVDDGGGAEYYITSTQPTSGYAELLNNGNYALLIIDDDIANVKHLGAYGNGTQDDTEAFKKAVELSNNVYVPSGDYLISSTIDVNKDLRIFGNDSTSNIITNSDIVVFNITGSTTDAIMEKLQFSNKATNRTNSLITVDTVASFNINKCYITNIETGGKCDLFVKSAVTSRIINSTFNHASITLNTWDCKIDKCFVWSLSQLYGIYIKGGSGNINITNTDVVPPLKSNVNYVQHANMIDNWATAKNQAGIVIGDTQAVTNIKMNNVYIDGNKTINTGRGIIINEKCFNILLANWSANWTQDDLIVLDSCFGVTITNGELTNCLGLDCSLINLIRQSDQSLHSIDINHNSIMETDLSYISTRKLASVIKAYVNFDGLITNNIIFSSGSTKETLLYTKAIDLNSYKSSYLLYTNKITGSDTYVEKTGTISSGSTGVTINYGEWGFDYQPSLSNIIFSYNNTIAHRIQKINNSSIYVAFESALASDQDYDLIVKL